MNPFRLVFTCTRKYTKALTITTASILFLVGIQLLTPWIIKEPIRALTNQGLCTKMLNLILQPTLITLAIYLARAGSQCFSLLFTRISRPISMYRG